jgi:hypothetical protein
LDSGDDSSPSPAASTDAAPGGGFHPRHQARLAREWKFTVQAKYEQEVLARSLQTMSVGQYGTIECTPQAMKVLGMWFHTGAIKVVPVVGGLLVTKMHNDRARICCKGSCAHYGHPAEYSGDGLYVCDSCGSAVNHLGEDASEQEVRR